MCNQTWPDAHPLHTCQISSKLSSAEPYSPSYCHLFRPHQRFKFESAQRPCRGKRVPAQAIFEKQDWQSSAGEPQIDGFDGRWEQSISAQLHFLGSLWRWKSAILPGCRRKWYALTTHKWRLCSNAKLSSRSISRTFIRGEWRCLRSLDCWSNNGGDLKFVKQSFNGHFDPINKSSRCNGYRWSRPAAAYSHSWESIRGFAHVLFMPAFLLAPLQGSEHATCIN